MCVPRVSLERGIATQASPRGDNESHRLSLDLHRGPVQSSPARPPVVLVASLLLGEFVLKWHATLNPRRAKPRAFRISSSALGGGSILRRRMAVCRSSYPDSGQVLRTRGTLQLLRKLSQVDYRTQARCRCQFKKLPRIRLPGEFSGGKGIYRQLSYLPETALRIHEPFLAQWGFLTSYSEMRIGSSSTFHLPTKASLGPPTNYRSGRARLVVARAVPDRCLIPGSGSHPLIPAVTGAACERTAASVC
jgi:hypothetical protein